MNNPAHHPLVVAAHNKLEATGKTEDLSLEELMMCFYGKPCERKSEKFDTRFKRGSILHYHDRVIIIANPKDEHLDMHEEYPHRRLRFISPQRCYGLMSHSYFFTQNTEVWVHGDPDWVRQWREHCKKSAPEPPKRPEAPKFAGEFRQARCLPEIRLWARLSASRLRNAWAEKAGYDEAQALRRALAEGAD